MPEVFGKGVFPGIKPNRPYFVLCIFVQASKWLNPVEKQRFHMIGIKGLGGGLECGEHYR
jgi:hypothetical protein